jgi:hypothetical protein
MQVFPPREATASPIWPKVNLPKVDEDRLPAPEQAIVPVCSPGRDSIDKRKVYCGRRPNSV